MSKRTASIRKGFEYQDRYCALKLLELVEQGDLEAQFQVESDEVVHVDDLVLKPTGARPTGYQVKYHMTQEHADSFESLIHRATARSQSLLQKLYKGWAEWSNEGEQEYEIHFISSNPAMRGRYRLGSAIDNTNHRFGSKFYTHSDYAKVRSTWQAHLSVDEDSLQAFLEHIVWEFSYESLEGLGNQLRRALQRLKFPFDDNALTELLEVIAYCATELKGDYRVKDFIFLLWKRPKYRDACEQRYPGLVEPQAAKTRRANRASIALIALESLPAYSGQRFVCVDEPVPFDDYLHGTDLPPFSVPGVMRVLVAWILPPTRACRKACGA
jgi:hypothetical protein